MTFRDRTGEFDGVLMIFHDAMMGFPRWFHDMATGFPRWFQDDGVAVMLCDVAIGFPCWFWDDGNDDKVTGVVRWFRS
jgi:hypothetical protein